MQKHILNHPPQQISMDSIKVWHEPRESECLRSFKLFGREESADKIKIYMTEDEDSTSIKTQLINSLKLQKLIRCYAILHTWATYKRVKWLISTLQKIIGFTVLKHLLTSSLTKQSKLAARNKAKSTPL